MLEIHYQYDLSRLNTLALKSNAHQYFELTSLDQLPELYELIKFTPQYFILGGGSNVILPENFHGLVIHNKLRGINVLEQDHQRTLVSAAAGEPWDEFVEYTLEQGYFGLENLSLIPGMVGASPIQNIGAYGVEVKDFIVKLSVYDLQAGIIKEFDNAQCKFSYRSSMFKQAPHYLVLNVIFSLAHIPLLHTNYGDIKLQISQINNPNAHDLREIIIKTRQSKLPDPRITPNAGSFFHNPVVDSEVAEKLKIHYPQLPMWPMPLDQIKLSAGWLIDNLKLKGFRQGNLAIYEHQALVIVNLGGATKSELLGFAKIIQLKVYETYKISLTIEPIIL